MSTLLAITTAVVLAAGDVPRAGTESVPLPALALADPGADTGVHASVEPAPPQTSRTVRIVSEVLIGGAAGTLAGGLGGWLGCLGSTSQGSCSQGTTAAGLVTGFGLGVAVMVPLTGSYFDAQGSPWAGWSLSGMPQAGSAAAIRTAAASTIVFVRMSSPYPGKP